MKAKKGLYMDLDDIRDDYSQTLFDKSSSHADPWKQAELWLGEAENSELPSSSE